MRRCPFRAVVPPVAGAQIAMMDPPRDRLRRRYAVAIDERCARVTRYNNNNNKSPLPPPVFTFYEDDIPITVNFYRACAHPAPVADRCCTTASHPSPIASSENHIGLRVLRQTLYRSAAAACFRHPYLYIYGARLYR